jgi:hypothetical protein
VKFEITNFREEVLPTLLKTNIFGHPFCVKDFLPYKIPTKERAKDPLPVYVRRIVPHRQRRIPHRRSMRNLAAMREDADKINIESIVRNLAPSQNFPHREHPLPKGPHRRAPHRAASPAPHPASTMTGDHYEDTQMGYSVGSSEILEKLEHH